MNTDTQMSAADLDLAVAMFDSLDQFEEAEKRGVRDPRTGRFIKHADYGEDAGLNIKFSVQSIYSKRESFLAGVTKYIDVDHITITIPGNRDLQIEAPVTTFYEWRFPLEYAAFKQGKGAVLTGTPLTLWPAMQPSQVEELKHLGIRTVEQLAELSDTASGTLRGFYAMKSKAKQFLEDAKDQNATAMVRAQMEDQAARHAAEMKAMDDRITAMMAQAIPKERKAKPSDDLN